jgi:hypothetical protein
MQHVCNGLSSVFFPIDPLQPPPRKPFLRTPKGRRTSADFQKLMPAGDPRLPADFRLCNSTAAPPCCPHQAARNARRRFTVALQPGKRAANKASDLEEQLRRLHCLQQCPCAAAGEIRWPRRQDCDHHSCSFGAANAQGSCRDVSGFSETNARRRPTSPC